MEDANSPPEGAFLRAIAPGLRAVRDQAAPLIIIQVAAMLLVVGYYQSGDLQSAATGLAQLKLAGGVLFSFLAGGVAGGVIPEIVRLATRRVAKYDRAWLAASAYNGLVYGIVGVQVDLFYQLQARVFGGGNDPLTLILKTTVDMALFTTLLSIPTAVLLYAWRRRRFAFKGWHLAFTRKFYMSEVWPTLIPCWAFWIPVLLCVYAMPPDLQFCFAILAEAAWSMVFVFMVSSVPSAQT